MAMNRDAATACASPETLEQLLADTLTEADAAPIREHLRSCAACQTALERLTDHPQLAEWSGAVSLAKRARALEPAIAPLLESLRATPSPRTTAPETDLP